MLKKILFIFFACQSVFGQNVSFRINSYDDIYMSSDAYHSYINDYSKDLRFLVEFLDNGKYFLANGILYDQKDTKILSYFKEFDAFVIRHKDSLQYLTTKEAFPKGYFIKDNTSKLYFGKKAEGYVFGSDVFPFKIWVTNEARVKNPFVDNLQEMGFLNAFSANQNIVAINFKGLEVDVNELKVDEERRFLLKGIDKAMPFGRNEEINNCRKRLDSISKDINYEDINYEDINEQLNFTYKEIRTITVTNDKSNQKEFVYTIFSNDNNSKMLFISMNQEKTKEYYEYFDYDKKIIYMCEKTDQGLLIYRVKAIIDEIECDPNTELKKISQKGTTSEYFYSKPDYFELTKITIDESFKQRKNINYPNGFIKRTRCAL